MNWLAIITFLGLAGTISAQFDTYYCKYVLRINCANKAKEETCGSDGVTYRTSCDLSQAFCRNQRIHIQHNGPCRSSLTTAKPTAATKPTDAPQATATTMKPVSTTTLSTVNGSEIAFDIFCLDLFHHDCSGEPDNKLCADDNMTYRNLCEYEKRKCLHRHMQIQYMGDCKQI